MGKLKKYNFIISIITFIFLFSAILKITTIFATPDISHKKVDEQKNKIWDSKEKLILIVVDGVPKKVLTNPVHYPKLQSITQMGNIIGHHKLVTGITSTMPAVKLMATGGASKLTSILQNFKAKELNGDSIFRQLSLSGYSVSLYGEAIWHDLFRKYIKVGKISYDKGFSDIETSDAEAFNQLMEDQPQDDFIILHLTGTDKAGHLYAQNDQRYIDYSNKIDLYIEKILTQFNNYNFIILADHGMGEGRSHASPTDPNVSLPPILFYGNAFKQNIQPEMESTQIAATISYFYGIRPPVTSMGIPYLDIFKQVNDQNSDLFIKEIFKNTNLILEKTNEPYSKKTWKEILHYNQSAIQEILTTRSNWIYLVAILLSLIILFIFSSGEIFNDLKLALLLLPSAFIPWFFSEKITSLWLFFHLIFILIKYKEIKFKNLLNYITPIISVWAISFPFWIINEKILDSGLNKFSSYIPIILIGIAISLYFSFKRKTLPIYFLLMTSWIFIFHGHRLKVIDIDIFFYTILFISTPLILINKKKISREFFIGTVFFIGSFIPRLYYTGLPDQRGLAAGPMLNTAPNTMITFLITFLFQLVLYFYATKGSKKINKNIFQLIALGILIPLLSFFQNGFILEFATLLVLCVLFFRSKEQYQQLLIGISTYWLLSSHLQVLGLLLLFIGIENLKNRYEKLNQPFKNWTTIAFLLSSFFFTGNSFELSGVENTILNPDLIVPSSYWLVITIGLIFLKTLIPFYLIYNLMPVKNVERYLMYFAFFCSQGVIFLFNRSYMQRSTELVPIILLISLLLFLARQIKDFQIKKI